MWYNTLVKLKKDVKMRFRSPPYPSFSLQKAIFKARQLYEKALHHSIPIETAAGAWKYKPTSSAVTATAAVLIQFGLLEDQGSGINRQLKLTDEGLRIVLESDPKSEKRLKTIKEAVLKPKIHREIWDKYGGDLPSNDVLKSYLIIDRKLAGKAPFSEKAATDLIKEFRETLNFAGINFDEETFPSSETENVAENFESERPNSSFQTAGVEQADEKERGTKLEKGEREVASGLISKNTRFKLIISGELGPKEIDNLIRKLEIDRDLLSDEKEDDLEN